MHYPELFYGVNVGRIQKDKRHFPESIVGEFGDLNTEVLGEIVSKEGLELFVGDNEGYSDFGLDSDSYEDGTVHIGQKIKSTYGCNHKVDGKSSGGSECTFFDVKQIIDLRQNPSKLIAKLKKIGLDVNPNELALYGISGID